MTKIVVPGGMVQAVKRSARYIDTGNECLTRDQSEVVAIAVADWLAENPIVPTREQCLEIAEYVACHMDTRIGSADYYIEWQRRMFLAPEPEVPEAVKDLLWGSGDDHSFINVERYKVDADILEAYRRGKNAR